MLETSTPEERVRFEQLDPANDSALTEGERRFLAALVELGVPFLVVGVGSAARQGARVVTEDVDLWFKDRTDRRIAAHSATHWRPTVRVS